MKKVIKEFFKYPIMIVFFLVLGVFTIADMLKPDTARSELENRALAQKPNFSLKAVMENKWTLEYNEYTKDQVLLRDDWVSIQSMLELVQGKIESNGVWFASGGYQIATNKNLSAQQQRIMPINVKAVVDFTKMHSNTSVMIIPSPANIMSFRLKANPPQIDENKLMDDIFMQMRAVGANVVDLRETFVPRKEEDLYYRTDHHWKTEGGAWFAYEAFCNAKGLQPIKPDQSLDVKILDFYGTNFSKSKKFGTKPETLTYYNFPNTLTRYQVQKDGSLDGGTVGGLMNDEALATYDKYSAFLHGNIYGYEQLEGDGDGSILIVKDSYANSFVPYLIANYGTIDIVDLRALPADNFQAVIDANEYDDILIMYSFNNFSEDFGVSNLTKSA